MYKAVRGRGGFKSPLVQAGFAVVMIGLLAACGKASGSSQGGTSSLQSGLAFYKGKTVTFISPDKPGGQSDVIMREIAPVVAKYLHATVQVTNVTSGGTIPGQDQAAAAKADGLTVGVLHVSKDISGEASGSASVNFPLTSVIALGSTPAPQNLLVASPSSKYKTIQDLLTATSPVPILTTGGSGAASLKAMFAAYGDKNVKILTGYGSSADLVQGFLRGDGPVTDTAASPLASVV
ncbi:MAG: hypothetical protein J2P27_02320, partial [Actinobacteria bacterium]|nr:hypothetical protein [Actinomycetota bacterium]